MGSARNIARHTAIYGLPIEMCVEGYTDLTVTGMFVLRLRDGGRQIVYCRQGYERSLEQLREELIARSGECDPVVIRPEVEKWECARPVFAEHRFVGVTDVTDKFGCSLLAWAAPNGTYRRPDQLFPTERQIAEVMVKPSLWRHPDAEAEIAKLCQHYGFEYVPPTSVESPVSP